MTTAGTHRSTVTIFFRSLIPLAIIAGGVLAYWAIASGLYQEPTQKDDNSPPPVAQVAPVKVHQGGLTIHADGVVVPYREITVATEVAGRVVERAEVCRAGNYVQQGTLLVRIDPSDYQLDVERWEKELQQAEVSLDELQEEIQGAESLITLAEKELELKSRELQRMLGLTRQAVSASDRDKSEMAELQSRNSLATLRNRVRLLQVGRGRLESARDLAMSNLKKAQLDLQRTQIAAPADGVIVNDFVEVDSFVQRGAPLFTLEDTSKVEVKCKLPMEDLYWIWNRTDESTQVPSSQESPAEAYDIPETHVQVIYRLSGNDEMSYVWEGRLTRYDGLGLDEKTRTVPCRVVVDQPRRRISQQSSGPPALMRGMYVTIRLLVDPATALLDVPETALHPGNLVWRVRDGKLTIVPTKFVTLLPGSGDDSQNEAEAVVYVDDPQLLTAGDLVVVSPLAFVRSGMEIGVAPAQAEEEGARP